MATGHKEFKAEWSKQVNSQVTPNYRVIIIYVVIGSLTSTNLQYVSLLESAGIAG